MLLPMRASEKDFTRWADENKVRTFSLQSSLVKVDKTLRTFQAFTARIHHDKFTIRTEMKVAERFLWLSSERSLQ